MALIRGVAEGVNYVSLTREAVGGAAEVDRGTTSGVFETSAHVGGAIAVATFVTLIDSTGGYGAAYLAGAAFALVGAAAVISLLPTRTTPTGTLPASTTPAGTTQARSGEHAMLDG